MKKNLLLTFPLAFTGLTLMAQESDKPNVVFIFADDLTYHGLGSTSDGEVLTPNLDRLKGQGTYFSRTYNQGAFNGAISVASRAMMNTGKYMWDAMSIIKGAPGGESGAWPEGMQPYRPQSYEQPYKLWSVYMKEAGYNTYMSGKWHVNNHSADEAFDLACNVRGGMPNQTPERYERKFIEGEPDTWCAADTTKGGYWKGGLHWSEVLRNDALGFIEEVRDQDDPFFLYLGFNAPHDPRQAPQEYLDMYPVEDVKVPESFMGEYPYFEQMGAGKALRDEMLAPFPRTEYSVRVNRKEYYALISHLDTQIGIIVDALEKSGKMDNTYIIFTADHGLAVGDHGFIGKQNPYESSIRVPMFILGPTIEKGKEVDNLVYLQDVMATALDLAGSEGVDNVDFESFLPVAQGKKVKGRDAIINSYQGSQRIVVEDRYKMIIYPTAGVVRLYDLESDPNELNDIIAQKGSRKIADRLLEKMVELLKDINDPLDVRPYYESFMN